jgi:hypothetical protein
MRAVFQGLTEPMVAANTPRLPPFAMRVGRRLGIDAPAMQTLRLIIEHHLLMASVSQRRDLDDPPWSVTCQTDSNP